MRPPDATALVSPLARALTIQVLTDTPSFAAAPSTDVFSESGRRRVMRAVSPSSAGGAGACLLVLDVDERGLLAGEADLDVTRTELRADLERSLGQELEQPQPQRGRERLAQPVRCDRDLLVADARQRGELGLQCLNVRIELHRDVIMTSLSCLSSVCVLSE